MGLSAFGAPCLLQTVVPQLERYAQLLQARGQEWQPVLRC